MALVNPNIAMSFRQPEFRPRNALAEYAQVQQIVGGQRQAEMADMQMEELRRERDALGRIQAAIVAKGGPPDLGAAADEMIRTGRPQFVNQGMAIRESLKKQRYFEEFESRFGAGRAAPSAAAPTGAAAPAGELVAAPMPSPTGTVRDIAPAAAPGAASRAVFNQDAIAGIDPETQKSISLILDDAAQLRAKADEFRGSVRASGFLNQAEQLENQAASMLAVQKRRASEPRFDTGAPATAEQVNAARQALAVGQAPAAANALAPAAAPVTNAMVAPAAQLAVPPAGVNQLASAGAGPNIDDLMVQYDLAAKAGHPRAPVILKQIEAALRGNKMSDRFVPVGNLVFDRQTEQFITPTEAQLGLTRPQQARTPIAVLQNGRPVYVSPEQAVGQTPFTPASVQVLGMGPGREPAAPTITQIQDPTDPSRMITIDARRYQGGGVGSLGVIGASGRSAPATAAALKQEQGASQAQDILDNLKFAYEDLNRQRAIPSTQRNVLSNTLASIGASGVGQVAGRVVGTEAQTQRDIIASARNQLFAAVKNATGLSAQNLNSNVEFTTWLNSLTDPAKSIETNREILSNMEKFIASGGKYTARGGGQTPAPAPAAAPAGGNLSPAEQAELDQLRARFGKNKP